jgi:lipopolysaccharide transport system permease protein
MLQYFLYPVAQRMSVLGFDKSDARMVLNVFKMNLADRFLGSSLGLAWAVMSPLILMGLYCFVFTYVFPGRLPGHPGSVSFLLWLISGYAPWMGISEGLTSSTASVVANAGLVKNIAFKSEVLPIAGALLGLVPMGVGFAVLVAINLLTGSFFGPEVLLVPFAAILQLVLVAGVGLFLAALNVFLRDTALLLPNALTALLFASPIFYSIESYPAFLRPVLALNPFYVLAEFYRLPLIEGRLPPVWMILYLTVVAAVLFVAGLAWFRRLKPYFDVRL